MTKYIKIIVVLLIFVLFTGCAYIHIPLLPTAQSLKEQEIEGKGSTKILIMDITGFISEREKEGALLGDVKPSMVAQVRETLQKAQHDPAVAGVIIRINSPGGTVTAADIIHHEIIRFKERKKIPLYACITSIGASGGYYIAAATDEITVHPTAITGSFAVILMSLNVEGLMGKIGVNEVTFKSGDKKDLLSPFRAATPEEKQIVQTMINQLHKRFVDTILARPGNTLSRKDVETLADGRIYTAEQALAVKIIDRIGYLDDVITRMKQQIKVEDARIITYARSGSYRGTIYSGSSTEPSRMMSLLAGGSVFDSLAETQFMYVWKP
ncbi:MAG: signal peptide peptidase SppA [Syntrophales bacterium]|nr:signal peptide peptidase SppA [Syntrophales bacterium]